MLIVALAAAIFLWMVVVAGVEAWTERDWPWASLRGVGLSFALLVVCAMVF
jgi:hypothetical protein